MSPAGARCRQGPSTSLACRAHAPSRRAHPPTHAACDRYHPVGFAWVAGGAHSACPVTSESDSGECPELDGGQLQYYVQGKNVTSDESGFGLDAYEPQFFNSRDWWSEQDPPYYVTLEIPADANYTRFYYFCHIHAGMSAEIEIVYDAPTTPPRTILNQAALNTVGLSQAAGLAYYTNIVSDEQPPIDEFDAECGTWDSSPFSRGGTYYGAACAGKEFLCGPGASGGFETCLEAIDCQMHYNMAVEVNTSTSKFATFARQMIPHHQNAVAMSKALLKLGMPADYPEGPGTEDTNQEWATGLAESIINAQNFQIQLMQAWLEENAVQPTEMCYSLTDPVSGGMVVTSTAVPSYPPTPRWVRGVDCDKKSAPGEHVTINLGWNAFASEWGQYVIEGCDGVSPKLHITAGVVYTFNQSNTWSNHTNW